MQNNTTIKADALPLHQSELYAELDSIITMEFNQGVRPWLTNYISCLQLEKQCHSIQMSSRRMDSHTKFRRMLDLSVAVLKSRWLDSYADRISQSEYEKLVDSKVAQLLKEAGIDA